MELEEERLIDEIIWRSRPETNDTRPYSDASGPWLPERRALHASGFYQKYIFTIAVVESSFPFISRMLKVVRRLTPSDPMRFASFAMESGSKTLSVKVIVVPA